MIWTVGGCGGGGEHWSGEGGGRNGLDPPLVEHLR